MTGPIRPEYRPSSPRRSEGESAPVGEPGKFSLPRPGGLPELGDIPNPGISLGDPLDVDLFLSALLFYYTLVSKDPGKVKELEKFQKELVNIVSDVNEGKITIQQALFRIGQLKREEGFPDMNDPKILSMVLSGLIYAGGRDAKEIAAFAEIKKELEEGKITPDEAQRRIQEILRPPSGAI